MASKRILVIDDEDDIREVAQLSLEMMAGWEVFTAESGSEGIVKAETHQPDAILLDVMMPDMDGPATYKKMRLQSSTQHIPVILLTAKVHPNDRRRFAELGVIGVIAKPFEPMTLASQVSQLLGWAL